MGYEVWGRAPGEGRAQAALVRPRAAGGYWGPLSTFTTEGEKLVQRVTEEVREHADETGGTRGNIRLQQRRDTWTQQGREWLCSHWADCGKVRVF